MQSIRSSARRGIPWGIFCACLLGMFAFETQAADPADYAVQVSASVSSSPPKITLSWPSYGASGYKIYRKNFGASSWGSNVASLSGSATSWTDSNVSTGSAYEYQIVRSASPTGYGYIYAGIEARMIDGRGKCALVVDSSMTGPLGSELDRLEMDLIGDGWNVQRVVVSRSDSIGKVRDAIKAANPRSVFLFGRIPVPYSGDFAPDGHADHTGAWPADVYYSEWNGGWSDSSVNDTQAKRSQNDNVRGDGKFDQSSLPSNTECEIGRVDLYDMGTFGKSETELLKQYLDKDHAFRNGQWNNARKGVIDDNFGDYQNQAFASNGWRNFAPMFGASNVSEGDFFSGSYLWGYGTGGGNYTSAAGVGSTSSFTGGTTVVFTMLFGSYFGDWDSTNNFLRAPLCAPSGGLTASWSARPYWYYQHMGLGEVIGYDAKLSQNNSGLYYTIDHSVRGVHMALMGDPTLRLHPVKPASRLTASAEGGVTLRWNASSDSNIVGYHVYRSNSQKSSYSRLTSSPISGTSYVDSSAGSGTHWYMVRAVKLETSGSGTYYNPSQGIFVSSDGSGGGGGGGGGGDAPAAPTNLTASGGDRQCSLAWTGSSGATSYKIHRSTSSSGGFSQVASTADTRYTDSGLANGTKYYYVVTAVNGNGESGSSNQASATPTASEPPPPPGGDLPSPWQDGDIGAVGKAGSASYSNGVFTLNGSGADIWGTADAFHFAYQPLDGDGTIVARVASLQNTDPWAKAGVMIRDGLAVNAAHAMSVVSYANNTAFQRRLRTGADTDHDGSGGSAPYWVKLVRSGSEIAGYVSQDGSAWTKINSCSIAMGSNVYIGLVVTAHNNSELCRATFDNVSVTTTEPPPPPPGGDLPAPWVDGDIGAVGKAGSASYSNGVFTLKGSGADIWGTADAFHFTYQPLDGDGTIVARVSSLQNTDSWAKAGVMIRDGLAANAAHAMSVVSYGHKTAFQRRLSTGADTDHDGSGGSAPYWVKLVRSGSEIAGYVSQDGSAWTKINSCSIAMGSNVYIGLVVTAHNNSELCQATFDNVSVTANGDGGNPPPGGTGGAIPGKFEAEDYCTGGEGVAYHDGSGGNEGGQYRQDDVDIGTTTDVGGGYYTGWIDPGEWLTYDINASASGTYTFTLRTATTRTGMRLHLEIDGANAGSATVPNTGGWNSWAYTSIANVNVTAGAHKLKVVFDTGVLSVNYITATSSAAARALPSLSSVGANPSPAVALEPVNFFAAVAAVTAPVEPAVTEKTAESAAEKRGAESDPIAIVWDFGDDLFAVGATSSHTYTAGGEYTVRVTVYDSAGHSEEKVLPLSVAQPLNAANLTVKKLIAGMNFKTANRDALRLDTALEIPADTALAGLPVSVDCGGIAVQGTLDAHGKASVERGLLKVTRRRGGTQARLALKLRRASLTAALANEGVQDADISKAPIAIPVIVRIGEQAFSGTFDGFYTGRAGRGGRVK